MHTKSQNSPNIWKKKTTHRILRIKVWQEKYDFTPKNIFLYNPQKDRTLSTSKNKIRNGGTSNYANPKIIDLEYTHSKRVVKISFSKGNSIEEILIWTI